MTSQQRTIAILTGGGDCPGLNAVIRAVVRTAHMHHIRVLGIERGYGGLLGNGRVYELTLDHVKDILHLGGTILGTTNRGNPFCYETSAGPIDKSDEVLLQLKQLQVDSIISVGGDGSQKIAFELFKKGINVIGIPKTIDNDLHGTEVTFGFQTAMQIATDALDRLHSTAESHDRVMILEVMGREAGFIALHTAIAGAADVCLIPEIPFNIDVVCEKIQTRIRRGTYFSLVVVAEGAFMNHDQPNIIEISQQGAAKRFSGIGDKVAAMIREKTDREVRVTVLGHIQRGGTPLAYDRILATRMGVHAINALINHERGVLVGIQNNQMITTPLETVLSQSKQVDILSDTVKAARAVGITFGDEPISN